MREKTDEKIANTLYLYGQEINLGTFAIAKINMFLHGLDAADIRRGDTLQDPQFLDEFGALKQFDIVVANPPYSIKDWPDEFFKTNRYGRLEGYDMPPKKNADYAFILHIIKSMKDTGRAGVVLPHGVLFRGGSEGRIREQILKNDLIEAVIAMPSKLFYGVGIPVCVLIFNKNKPDNKKNKILFIDAEKDYAEGKNQNSLRKKDIDKIVNAYDDYKDVEKFARIVDLKEIDEENEFNLNVRRYIENGEEEEEINVSEVWKELKELEQERAQIDKEVEGYLAELKY